MKCYCGSNVEFSNCCAQFLNFSKSAETAEQLMRSRYSAFCTGNLRYLVETHAPETREPSLEADLLDSIRNIKWKSLSVLKTSKGKVGDLDGFVTFKVEYTENGNKESFKEISRFERRNNRWLYIDGTHV